VLKEKGRKRDAIAAEYIFERGGETLHEYMTKKLAKKNETYDYSFNGWHTKEVDNTQYKGGRWKRTLRHSPWQKSEIGVSTEKCTRYLGQKARGMTGNVRHITAI